MASLQNKCDTSMGLSFYLNYIGLLIQTTNKQTHFPDILGDGVMPNCEQDLQFKFQVFLLHLKRKHFVSFQFYFVTFSKYNFC